MHLTLGATTRPWDAFSYKTACDAIAKAGYSDVAFYINEGKIPITSATTPQEAREVKSVAENLKLNPSLVLGTVRLDLSVDEAVADYCQCIDACKILGTTWLMNGGTEDPATYEAFREIMRQCAPYAQEHDIRLAMKPHGGIGLTGKMMVETVEAVGHPNFCICYDPGNIIYYTAGALRPETDVHDVAPHVGLCIIKDCVLIGNQPDVLVMPGEGLVDFVAVLKGLLAGGFDGPLYVECLGGTELDDINARAVKAHRFVENAWQQAMQDEYRVY